MRSIINFSNFPEAIKEMTENSSDAASVIDELIEFKGENITLTSLILLDGMNIRGIQIYNLFKICHENIHEFYNKILNITDDDINLINLLSAPLCNYKAVYSGKRDMFSKKEREEYTHHIQKDDIKDLYPSINTLYALELINKKGFICGYKTEYVSNEKKITYRIFYNKSHDILYATSLDNMFLYGECGLVCFDQIINLKENPFKVYSKVSNKKYITNLPIIKSSESLKYKDDLPNYNSCVIGYMYDLLNFNNTFRKLDNDLQKIYKNFLSKSEDKAYDMIIKYLNYDEGMDIVSKLQIDLNVNLSKTKLLAAKDRFYRLNGYDTVMPKNRFLSSLIANDMHMKNLNTRIMKVIKHDLNIKSKF